MCYIKKWYEFHIQFGRRWSFGIKNDVTHINTILFGIGWCYGPFDNNRIWFGWLPNLKCTESQPLYLHCWDLKPWLRKLTI